MNYHVIEVMLKEKHADMLREGKRLQMIKEYERSRRVHKKGLGLFVAELLISVGEKLRKRYETRLEAVSH